MKLVVPTEAADPTPLTRLLEALGVLFARVSLDQALATGGGAVGGEATALILSAEQLARVQAAHAGSGGIGRLLGQYASVLIFPFQSAPEVLRVLREWVEGELVVADTLDAKDTRYSVAADFAAAGPFAGQSFGAANPATDIGVLVRGSPHPVEVLVKAGNHGLFTKIALPSTELFVLSTSAVFDVTAEVVHNLNASQCFSGLAPLLFFLRHCKVACWQTPNPAANVVVDDPPLKPKYGFVDAKRLGECVRELGAAVAIGFIPWNYQRTSPRVVELFLSNWPRLSLSIHGCDHTGAEFSTQTVSASLQRIALAMERMRQLQARTGLRYDRIIVFPQGKFSAAAMQALRQSEMLAAVNTELLDQQAKRGVRAGELLQPAITTYSGFPLFLRRPATEPLANFALDLLLGKPALVVTHHDYFQQGLEPFASLVRAISGLVPDLNWSNLEAIATKAVGMRSRGGDGAEVRLLSARTELSAQALHSRPVRFSKAESCPGKSFEVWHAGRRIESERKGGILGFEAALEEASPAVIEVKVSPLDEAPLTVRGWKYRVKVAGRRYLSEFRDNYVAKSYWATTALRAARGIAKSRHNRAPAGTLT